MGRVMMMKRTVAAARGMASARAVGVLIIAGAAMGAAAFLAQRALAQASGASAEASAQEKERTRPAIAEVEVRGTGAINLILVPGLACDWTVWESFMERNADRYRMHAVTLAGFGGTEPISATDVPLDQPSWLDAAVEGLASYIREHDLEQVYVVGHSMGSMIAYTMAVEHGELIRGAVAVDGMPAYPLSDGTMTPEQRRQMVDQMVWPQMRGMTEAMWDQQKAMILESELEDEALRGRYAKLMDETPAPVAGRYLAELLRHDMRPKLKDAEAPIAVLAAINDHSADRGFGKERLRAFWIDSFAGAVKTQVHLVEDAGHFLMDEKPQMLDEVMARFVSGRDITTGADARQVDAGDRPVGGPASPRSAGDGAQGAQGDARGAANPAVGMGRMLAESIRSVEGCLGVDIGQFESGKAVIIGWFEDKEAATRWYYHPVHQRMMGRVEGVDEREPLADVPDDTPLMVVAAITFADRPEIEGIPLPISQISIEVYAPMKAGAQINGRFAPDDFAPGLVRDFSDER